MNPESKEFIVAAGQKDGYPGQSSVTQSTQTQQVPTETKQLPYPIPSIVVTPFVNQLPSETELLGYNLDNKQANHEMKHKPKETQAERPASGMLMPPGMSDSNMGSPAARQLGDGSRVIARPGSPWLMEFESYPSNNIPRGNPMAIGYRQGQVGQHSYMTSFTPQLVPGSNLPLRSSGSALRSNLFCALASRAYQEAVKIPENPPPPGWVPGEPIDIYYEELLMRFQILFRKILEVQGCYDESIFRTEWLHHCHNIMTNLRNEWTLHPFGSVDGIKTTLHTKNAMAASLALRSAAEKAKVPPPSDWKTGEALQPYYESMLARFERHLGPMLAERRLPIFDDPVKLREAIDEYSMFIIREFRTTWFEMFPQ